jgi:predicted transcriptional regulator
MPAQQRTDSRDAALVYRDAYCILSYTTQCGVCAMAGLSLRLPEDLESKLDAEARREGVPRSEVARTAIAEFLDRKQRERYIAAFVAEAQAAYADPQVRKEALGLAEEALPLDNEGLREAETRGRYAATSARRRGKKRR